MWQEAYWQFVSFHDENITLTKNTELYRFVLTFHRSLLMKGTSLEGGAKTPFFYSVFVGSSWVTREHLCLCNFQPTWWLRSIPKKWSISSVWIQDLGLSQGFLWRSFSWVSRSLPGGPRPTSYKSGDIAPLFFGGGEIFFTPVKPGNFFWAIFCRGFFNGSIFQRSVRDLPGVPFTRISRWVPSKLHDLPFSISFSEVRFSLMDQKNPIELVDTFDTFGTSFWYILFIIIIYYYYIYYYYYRYKYKCRWWFYTAFSTILYPYPYPGKMIQVALATYEVDSTGWIARVFAEEPPSQWGEKVQRNAIQ